MTPHVGAMFSTKDRDNDLARGSLAKHYQGGWWFKGGEYCDLNGEYYRGGPISARAKGISWNQWKGYLYSLEFTEMKIRPYY